MIINNYIKQNIFYIDTTTVLVYFYLINKYIYVGKNL